MTVPAEPTEETKYERILALLAEHGPMSTYQLTRKLDVNGTGQVLHKLRNLEKRGRVVRIAGDRPGWTKWTLV